MSPLMTIGDFSRATRLTSKALRFYHRNGVLAPAYIDPSNGYRLYAPDQIADAQIVRTLRELDVPVDAIREIVTTPDVAMRARLISRHLDSMERKLEKTRMAVTSLHGLLEEPAPAIQITHRSVPETRVVAVSDVIGIAELGTWFRAALATLQETAAAAAPATTGVYGGMWSNELFAEERGEAMLYLTVDAGFEERAAHPRTTMTALPAVELAVATHDGPDTTVPQVYAALGQYVAQHEISIDAPVRETYVSGFPGIDERTVTEIGWPIFRLAR